MKTMKKQTIISFIIPLILMIAFGCNDGDKTKINDNENLIKGEYFGQEPPGKTAELFAPGILSTGLYELNSVFFPNMKELIFSVALVPMQPWEWRLVMMKEENGSWTKPEIAEFNKDYSGVDPFVTDDGNRIYFCSNRPISGKGEPEDNFDIWYVDRTESGWTDPVNLGTPVNSDKNDFYPSLTKDGTMYFQSRREGGMGESDIYFSKLTDGKYSKVEILPEPVNSEASEGDVFIAPDETYLILSSDRKENNIGRADLWISFKMENGSWSDIVNLGPEINSEGVENCQILSPCGKYLFFTSRQSSKIQDSTKINYESIQKAWTSPQNTSWFGDIYWVDAEVINDLRDSVFSVSQKNVNQVYAYLKNADLQYEGESQKENIVNALNDIVNLPEEQLRVKKYKDYSGKEDQWDLTALIYKYFVPDKKEKTLGDNFFQVVKSKEVQKEVKNILESINVSSSK